MHTSFKNSQDNKPQLSYYTYTTPIGPISITCTDSACLSLSFGSDTTIDQQQTYMTDRVYAQLLEYFHGKRTNFELPLQMEGTPFQKKVWKELLRIPYGETRSYVEIATAIGNPKAARAVGMANHHNPIAIIVPCHRVIGKDGKLVGYASGLAIKKQLLELEGIQVKTI